MAKIEIEGKTRQKTKNKQTLYNVSYKLHDHLSATILLKIPNDKIPELHPVIHQLATKFSFNEDVADLMLVLSRVDANESAVKLWIESLPGIITNAKVTKSHLEAVRILFKSRNEVMLKAFQTMMVLRKCGFIKPNF